MQFFIKTQWLVCSIWVQNVPNQTETRLSWTLQDVQRPYQGHSLGFILQCKVGQRRTMPARFTMRARAYNVTATALRLWAGGSWERLIMILWPHVNCRAQGRAEDLKIRGYGVGGWGMGTIKVSSSDLETKLSSRNFSQKQSDKFVFLSWQPGHTWTWISISSFKYFRTVRKEKQIRPFPFGRSYR